MTKKRLAELTRHRQALVVAAEVARQHGRTVLASDIEKLMYVLTAEIDRAVARGATS